MTALKSGARNAPTIRDIAAACGVSEATVSYVINGKRVLRPDTRERVFRVMREMNYHPSAVARGLSKKRVQTLGVLFGVLDPVTCMTDAYLGGILQGVMEQAQRAGFNITLFTERWQNSAVSAPPLRDGRTDGVLVLDPSLTSGIMESLQEIGIPVVAVSAEPKPGIQVVDVDNYAGALLATRHLLELGHRRIAYLSGHDDLASYAPRRAAFCDALNEYGVEPLPELMRMADFNDRMAFHQTIELLQLPEPPTAIFAANDTSALGVLEAAQTIGVKVPDQLSVIGFDDIPAAALVTPSLTTVRQPMKAIGATATSLLIEHIRHPVTEKEFPPVLLSPELVVRNSTGPVPR